MNLNNDIAVVRAREVGERRPLRLGPLHQLHPGRSRSLIRHHNRLHRSPPCVEFSYLRVGYPPEYLAASRKGVGPDQWDAFEAQVRAMDKQMARIKITPLWAKLLDFQTRFPTPIEKLIRRAG